MSSLLAILLVVNSTRGHHYLFSYPTNPKRPSSFHQQRFESEDHFYGSSVSCLTNNDDKRQSIEADPDPFAGRDTIFNIDVSFLADALAPKFPLCDRKFQLCIDDLTFVGHPVSLTSPQNEPREHEETPSAHVSPKSPLTPNTTPSPHDQQEENDAQSIVNESSYSETESDHGSTDGDDRSNKDNDDIHDESSLSDGSPGSIHMTLFHVVFVLSPPDLELNAQVETLYKHVILKYSSALRYEQLRCGYVQEEIEKVLALKEEAYNKSTPYNQVMSEILQKSSLARDIRQIYTAISSNAAAHVIINDFIDLSLQIPILGTKKATSRNSLEDSFVSPIASSLMDIYSVTGYEYDNYPILCPYHTLLLLEDPEEVLKNMPLDASPTLVQLVQILTPTQSLQELHLLLDCSLAQIYRLAAHLIYWRKAKLINTISTRNVYVVSPTAKLEDMAALEADFRQHIPNLSLPILLSKLQHTQQYYQVYRIKELKNQYLEAITWLIRKDLVVQVHMYLVLIQNGAPQPQIDENNTEDVMPSSPNNGERLKRITANHERVPKEVADLFERLKPYMKGHNHIDEIVYREGISRRQLGLVLKYYRDRILIVYHY
ncbi:UPF0171-domain-containing protein [Rhizopus microsporus ATCC 52813]|uniref:Nitrogen permease regulator 3 n=1 Tax=Rhizopus microsporus ATCC 52813 TaxID=1340429 RepID=A0A2G4SJB9_RHIZD|nr:UPF0171-domain-containing protein [Rhizopus microsporus ATCC 52813]PHZ08859.1 UPF0171-domain-containing protein [Rhizopus microsporus ATCC 52813]